MYGAFFVDRTNGFPPLFRLTGNPQNPWTDEKNDIKTTLYVINVWIDLLLLFGIVPIKIAAIKPNLSAKLFKTIDRVGVAQVTLP